MLREPVSGCAFHLQDNRSERSAELLGVSGSQTGAAAMGDGHNRFLLSAASGNFKLRRRAGGRDFAEGNLGVAVEGSQTPVKDLRVP